MLIELSDLSLYLLSYTALDVIGIFLELLPKFLTNLSLKEKGLVSDLCHHDSLSNAHLLAIVVLI
jgi:hypothetical protein